MADVKCPTGRRWTVRADDVGKIHIAVASGDQPWCGSAWYKDFTVLSGAEAFPESEVCRRCLQLAAGAQEVGRNG